MCSYAEEVSWPFKLNYYSNPYVEEDGSLGKSDFYKILIETCNEKGRRYTYTGTYLNGLSNLTLDSSIKWLRQLVDEPDLTCKITTDDRPKFRLLHLIDSSFPHLTPDTIGTEKRDSIARSVNMWSIKNKEYTRSRAVRIMSTGVAYGFFSRVFYPESDLEYSSIVMTLSVVIPENIGNPGELDWNSTLKIVRFEIEYNLKQYLENQENLKDDPEYKERCDCEALRIWDIDDVTIEGEEIKTVDFLKGEGSLLIDWYGWL